MALKRFICTDLTTQSWYSELEPKYKALWIHLLLACDCAGSFEITPKLFTAFIGAPITEADIFTRFGRRVIRWRDKGLITAFVRHQYYSAKLSRLSPMCKPHKAILARLAELGLDERRLDELSAGLDEQQPQQQELGLTAPEPAQPAEAEKPRRNVIPPKIEWVREYCASRNRGVSPERFFDFYTGKGWKVGREKMKDWEAAVRTWEGRESGANGASGASSGRLAQSFEQTNYTPRGGF